MSSKFAIVGGGMMGQLYVKHLTQLGIETGSIRVADTSAALRKCISDLFSGVQTYADVRELPEDCDSGIVAVPTSLHLDASRVLIKKKTKDILCEKPFGLSKQILEAQRLIAELGDVNLQIGHLCNASLAFSALKKWCDEMNTRPETLDLEWKKNRILEKPQRLTHGFVTDEMTHPLALAVAMARHFGCTQWKVMEATVITNPYTNDAKQRAAHERNPLIPLHPNSEAYAKIRFSGDGDPIIAHVGGSYTAEKKNRSISVVTADNRRASIQFDYSPASPLLNCDKFTIEGDTHFVFGNKQSIMLGAFKEHRPSDALFLPADALDLMRMQAEILEMGQ